MQLNKLRDSIPKLNILVVGDIILDEYIVGNSEKISPEAPVPILNATKREYRLGGAANVANNLCSIGVSCTLIGQVGEDETCNILKKQLNERSIEFFFVKHSGPTIIKTRIVAQNQQLIRIDWEKRCELTKEHLKEVNHFINGSDFDLIIISDYNKGAINADLINILKKLNIKIIVDPKPQNINLYNDVYAITPNLKEVNMIISSNDIDEGARELSEQINSIVLVTMGPEGIMLIDGREKHYFPAKAKEIYDVSGAGDTLVALFSICIASGYTNQESAIIANQAAGIVVGKFGTASLTLNELTESFDNNERKIKTTNELVEILDKLRRKNKKIVFTNGCFDILHVGHMKLLNKAKQFGDVLILGLNSDESIQIIKGPDRPINSEYERIEVLSNISPIDYIVLFNESTPKKLISIIKPDIHVKGGDYNPDDINNMPEAEIVKTYGGIVKIVPRYKNMSTSNLLNKIGGK